MSSPAVDGLLVLDKPAGMTSRAAVDQALRWFPRRTRMGHTGTLDPLATGVLVLCLGTATRLTEYVQRMHKTYRTEVRLGARSDSDDADGTITPVADAVPPPEAEVRRCLAEFVGVLEQVPPAFSAAHVTGRRAYDLARQGLEVDLSPRPVHVHAIDLLRYAYPALELEISCGKGTYIRSLARDLGARLDCGGLVQTLRRTRVGPFTTDNALSLSASAEEAQRRLQPASAALAELPRLTLAEPDARRLCQGQRLRRAEAVGLDGQEVAVFRATGDLLAVALAVQGELRPGKVFAGR